MSRLTRRELLGSVVLAACVPARAYPEPATMSAEDAFDHILLGAPDLDEGVRWVEERTGAKAKFGGVHPGRGTRNALVGLGKRHYMEILAPDPAQTTSTDERAEQLRGLTEPRIVGWAVGTTDIAETKRDAEASGLKTLGPSPGSRKRPDGRLLKWQTLFIVSNDPLTPFFIEWDPDSPHPSQDAPPAGTVLSLQFASARPDAFADTMKKLGIRTIVELAPPKITLQLKTAKGLVELS